MVLHAQLFPKVQYVFNDVSTHHKTIKIIVLPLLKCDGGAVSVPQFEGICTLSTNEA